MITRNKKPPSLARMCISVMNLYLPVMAVTEFQAFGAGRWFRIWCSFPIQERWGTLGVTVKKCLRHTPDMDIHASHFSTASNSTLYGSVPYMETLPRTKGGGVWFQVPIFLSRVFQERYQAIGADLKRLLHPLRLSVCRNAALHAAANTIFADCPSFMLLLPINCLPLQYQDKGEHRKSSPRYYSKFHVTDTLNGHNQTWCVSDFIILVSVQKVFHGSLIPGMEIPNIVDTPESDYYSQLTLQFTYQSAYEKGNH